MAVGEQPRGPKIGAWLSDKLFQNYIWRSIFRSHRDGVHGYEMHQAFEQHLENVWLES